jgi:hypothetical protein
MSMVLLMCCIPELQSDAVVRPNLYTIWCNFDCNGLETYHDEPTQTYCIDEVKLSEKRERCGIVYTGSDQGN